MSIAAFIGIMFAFFFFATFIAEKYDHDALREISERRLDYYTSLRDVVDALHDDGQISDHAWAKICDAKRVVAQRWDDPCPQQTGLKI